MTTAADDTAVEEAFEAYLAGRVVPAAGSGLVSFADAVRASATEPGRPSAALADLLATGLLTDLSSPSTATARPAPRRRRRTRMFLPALFAKIAGAGLAAKAAAGAGIVVVGLTTVGFTGHLPGSAQHTFATVVDSVTPLTAPDPEVSPADDTPTDTTTTTTTTTTVTGTDDGTGDGTDDAGTAVPAAPSNYGQQVSDWAHQKNEDRKAGASTVPAKPSKAAEPGDDSGTDADDDSGTDGSASRDGAVAPAENGGSSHGSSEHGKGGGDH